MRVGNHFRVRCGRQLGPPGRFSNSAQPGQQSLGTAPQRAASDRPGIAVTSAGRLAVDQPTARDNLAVIPSTSPPSAPPASVRELKHAIKTNGRDRDGNMFDLRV
jgi:hypothetical protein